MSWIEQEDRGSVTGQTANLTLNERVNPRWRGTRLYIQVTAAPGAPGSGGLRARLNEKVPGFAPATYFPMNDDAPLITAVGIYTYTWYPGATSGGTHATVMQSASIPLPYVYQIVIEHADAQAYDYHVWEERIP